MNAERERNSAEVDCLNGVTIVAGLDSGGVQSLPSLQRDSTIAGITSLGQDARAEVVSAYTHIQDV